MTTLLDLPDGALTAILGHCPFKAQSLAACASTQLRSAAEAARAVSALQRRADGDRFCREGLPLVGELRRPEDPRLVVPHAAVLHAYDRAAPPPPGAEGVLHAWYRQAADLFARQDEMCARGEGVPFLGPKVQYIGPVDAEGQPHGFGIAYIDDGTYDGLDGYYVGEWRGGLRSGFGLMEFYRPTVGSYHGMFSEDAPSRRGELILDHPSQFSWEGVDQVWLQALAPRPVDPRDALLGENDDDVPITAEEAARLNAAVARHRELVATRRQPSTTAAFSELDLRAPKRR